MATINNTIRPRILVLHGFFDSAQNREHQMRSLTRTMKDMEFVFINSSFPFVNYGFLKPDEDPPADQRYQWFSYRPEWPVTDYSYDTLNESVTFIVNYIQHNGPFHGLLGFSQGAIVCVAALLNVVPQISLPDCMKFAIIVGCPSINDPTVKSALDNIKQHQQQIATLHVSGMNDTLITSAMSEMVFNCFDPSKAEFYQHKGGHYVPSDPPFRQKLRDFVQRTMSSP